MEFSSENERLVVLRILDANANRCAEGLRVVEEIVRFSMDDPVLFERFKELRHAVRLAVEAITSRSHRFRDSEGDVGRSLSTRTENYRDSLEAVARANFARSQEALRVMEEFGKLIEPEKALRFKQLRFELYTLERNFFGRSVPRGKLPQPPFLYGLLDRVYVSGDGVAETADRLLEGGVDVIQYRAKGIDTGERRADLVTIIARAAAGSIPVIVNDDPELAAEVGAAGVHLGVEDPSPEQARAILGPEGIVGLTVHSTPEFEGASLEAIDYVAVGSIYPSETKRDVAAVGLGLLRELKSRVAAPVVAIGGISLANVDEVLDAGADGIALVSALLKGDVKSNCMSFRLKIDEWRSSKGFTKKG